MILQLLDGKNQSESVLESPDMLSRMGTQPQLFLASNSPRRRQLLAICNWDFETLVPQVDETPLPGENGTEYVQRLAESKVTAAASQAKPARLAKRGSIVIAADTTVVTSEGTGSASIPRILGKPQDQAEAAEMLRELRGHTHQVHTAVSILASQDGSMVSDLCTTDVPMRNYSDEEISTYIASGDPMDKAGAYAIQHAGFHPVEKLSGCFANVMGLPLCHLTRSLKMLGVMPPADVAQACQAALGYNCPVYQGILEGKVQDFTHR